MRVLILLLTLFLTSCSNTTKITPVKIAIDLKLPPATSTKQAVRVNIPRDWRLEDARLFDGVEKWPPPFLPADQYNGQMRILLRDLEPGHTYTIRLILVKCDEK